MSYNTTVERPATSRSKSVHIVTTKSKRTKPEPPKAYCHRILCTPATYSVSSIGGLINQAPQRFAFMGHEISVRSADAPLKLDSFDRKLLDFILILLTKYLSATGPWVDGWVSFTLGDVLHCFCIDEKNTRYDKLARICRTYFDRICLALDKLALLRLRQDDGPEFGLVESYRLVKPGGEARKRDVIAGRACFVIQTPQSLLDHLAEQGVTRRGKLRVLPFLDSLFNGVSANTYAIAKRMMAHYHFRSNNDTKNRNKLRVQTLVECCPDLKAKLPADRRRTFDKALVSLVSPVKTIGAIIPCCYAAGRPPAAYEGWLDAVIQFEPHEVEYISRAGLDTAHYLLSCDDDKLAHDIDDLDAEQQSESITPDVPAVLAHPGGTPNGASSAIGDSGAKQWDISLPGLSTGG